MTKRFRLILIVILAITATAAAYYRVSSTGDTPEFTTLPAKVGSVVATVRRQ